jgi:hypothetical protein
MRPRALIAVGMVAVVAVVGIGSAGAQLTAVKGPIATPQGVGPLRLGKTIAQLRDLKLIGGAGKGCELAPGEKAAPLKPPLSGSAIFYPAKRLSAISLTGGAETAAGIHVGSSLAAARKAYPGAPYDNVAANRPIPVGLLWIGGREKPKMTLVTDPAGTTVREIAIPSPNFCE